MTNDEPDLHFRGSFCWTSEVGSKTLGIVSFYIRAICMDRNLWAWEKIVDTDLHKEGRPSESNLDCMLGMGSAASGALIVEA